MALTYNSLPPVVSEFGGLQTFCTVNPARSCGCKLRDGSVNANRPLRLSPLLGNYRASFEIESEGRHHGEQAVGVAV